ncbi:MULTISPECIES: methyl-accepting chemotaxis protein [Pseudomonas syringae group]|uniref:Chemotaxis protein n=6 Tax=Pseudomonas TaxID=286 RepID=A0AAX1VQR2_PSEAJ|nr:MULTISPECIES: methyl-accepting chemotaxis protein [Pseudomonas syringae group]KEZ26425.1 chemotaxis protein [Pseudomonas amygdali pv. tabaci str. 6605]KPY79780.1 Chemotaxis protein [Pseudomonas amygdali pv. tabaci]MDU8630130.1 methyl-accepting chemotaxis protein [Pseudomonas syringae group sp. 243L2]MDU8644938.1 methyl-accepting chemotaxis protein [Pseudomonas syringae group sp. 26L6]QOI05122.1 methyl-accepting chemotaxis protein [Pseudomonas savastanoi]
MFAHLKVRTGMIGVLVLFVIALMFSIVNSWSSAMRSYDQVDELRHTSQQIDGINNSLLLAIRTSANVSSAFIETVGGRFEDAEARLMRSEGIWNDAIAKLDASTADIRDSKLQALADELKAAFAEYGNAIVGQRAATRARSADQYFVVNISAGKGMTKLQEIRVNLVGALDARAAEINRDASERLATAKRLSLVLACITLALAVICWMFISSRVLRPLREAGENFKRIANGDLTQEVVPPGRNEIGDLFVELQRMQASQRNTLILISGCATQLASAAEELNAVTEESNRGLQQQDMQLEQAATAVNQMTSAVEEVARNAVSTSQAATASNTLSEKSRQQVRENIAGTQLMTTEIQGSAERIQHLAGEVRNIGKVLDVIRAVSEQTNLLALNAAIEAARAGEAGRGFAVVADEVRTLAYRTQESTREIEQMIGSVQTTAEQAVDSMRGSTLRAQGTLEITQASGAVLEDIFAAIGQINERNLVIASAAEEQAQVAREVDSNLVAIRDLSAQSAAGALQTNAASHELSRLAVELNDLVSRFRT